MIQSSLEVNDTSTLFLVGLLPHRHTSWEQPLPGVPQESELPPRTGNTAATPTPQAKPEMLLCWIMAF
jgi:hypothetical protein